MNAIAKLRDGTFYFVEKIDTVDEMFVDALSGLFTIVAQSVSVSVRLAGGEKSPLFADVNVSKTYGDIWKVEQGNQGLPTHTFVLAQLMEGVSKEFLLEL